MMDEKSASSSASAEQSTSEQNPADLGLELASEHREAYGTAKTENLRDSGWWRILLPGFVVLCCLAVLAIPLIILALLLRNSPAFIWTWVVMLIIEVGVAAILIRGFIRIFMTQAGNYRN
jgi:uncharacterized membrane protein YcjF (UPF0283 family)